MDELSGLLDAVATFEDGVGQMVPARPTRPALDRPAWEVGLRRYSAEELGMVRTFLRIDRHFYERQAERFARVAPPGPN